MFFQQEQKEQKKKKKKKKMWKYFCLFFCYMNSWSNKYFLSHTRASRKVKWAHWDDYKKFTKLVFVGKYRLRLHFRCFWRIRNILNPNVAPKLTTISTLGKTVLSRRHLKIVLLILSQKIGFWILCTLSPSRKHAYIILTPLNPIFI